MKSHEVWKQRAPQINAHLEAGATINDLANMYGCSPKTITNRLGELWNEGIVSVRPAVGEKLKKQIVPDSDDIQGGSDELEIDVLTNSHKSRKMLWMSEKQNKDPDFVMRAHGYDPEEWKLVNIKSKIWNAHNKKDGVLTLYSSHITAVPKKDELTVESLRGLLMEMTQKYIPPTRKPLHVEETGKLLEVNVADLHLGKLAWVGDANDTYNEKIAEERFFYVIDKVLSKTENYKFEKILFVFSNDFFHIDGESKATTGGTPQDTNLQYTQMFKYGVRMLVEAIDILSRIAPVRTFYIGSNHDKLTSYYATEYLYAWFRNDPNVQVDADPKIRKYYEYGNCLIGFSHGHAEKNRLGKIMPVEAREAWGRTIYHEFHCGHWHTDKVVVEENGVIVRYLPSVTGTDNWHYESGYVGAVQKSQSFVWDKHEGVEQIINATVLRKNAGEQDVNVV